MEVEPFPLDTTAAAFVPPCNATTSNPLGSEGSRPEPGGAFGSAV
jgi:hypothetical protein